MQLQVVAHEDARQRPGQELRRHRQHQGEAQQQHQAFFQHVAQLFVILGTVVEADDGGGADGEADEHGDEDEVDVHDDTVGGNAVLPGEGHELDVVEHGDQTHGKVAHQLRGAVDGGPQQGFSVIAAPAQPQQAAVFPGEVDDGDDGTDGLGDGGGDGSADESPAKYAHEQGIEHDVGAARGHGHGQRQIGLLGGDAEALEGVLQNVGGEHRLDDIAVGDGILQHLPLAAQQSCCRAHEDHGQQHQRNAADDSRIGQQGEDLVGPLMIAHAKGHGHQSGAAGADHEAQGGEDHQIGNDEVDGGEGGLAGEIGYEEPVHHAVDAGEDHHGDRRQGEAQKPGIGKVVGKLNGHGKGLLLIRRKKGTHSAPNTSKISQITEKVNGKMG